MSVENGKLCLAHARVVFLGGVSEGVNVLLDGARIEGFVNQPPAKDAYAANVIDLRGSTLYPGFIDAHIHGAVGVDTMEASPEDLRRVAEFLAREGVTSWLPTLVPAPVEDYARAAASIENLMAGQDERATPAARALGLHYEGPFINSAQCGALRPSYFRIFRQPADVDALPVAGAPQAIRMITVAPEIEGGIELVRELKARGWVVSIGHTRADVETLDRARAAGARHMTHFFNAMSPLHQRTPGPVGWGLLSDDVTCDIIADGHHVAPLMLQLALRCKTPERLCLISDAVAPAGQGDGEFRIWGETIKVAGGRTANERGSIAGSVSTMRDNVRQMLALGVAPPDVARMASANPARLLGVAPSCGTIEEGKRADLVALDEEGNVRLTVIGGRVAFDALRDG
ncbi:MAG TPA: N-acetylglucosamine-6-phosphate deacetylase [Pyrinomonadaceae bacterium]|jgi:N-acetylglucosamine-6-phosphate deacetylase|nr:N-acetylglucosamine-6-phosphate deacetylase [Pyrinomonadaceae bacterium]